MESKYSRKEFDGYTHRFIVELRTAEPASYKLDLYSNSGSKEALRDFINKNKSEKLVSFTIVHQATKKQDELTAKFIDETLKDL